MDKRRCFVFSLAFFVITFVSCLTFTNQYAFFLESLPKPLIDIFTAVDSPTPTNSSINKTENATSNNTAQPFRSRVSDYYPRMPIHIYTQDIPPQSSPTKLILLGNGFFGTRNWDGSLEGNTSTKIMTTLSCPFLSNYCDVTANMSRFSEADAVVYHLRDSIDQTEAKAKRRSGQRLVFTLWESPPHTPDLKSFRGFFNWTMTYRFKSDVLTSYYSGNAFVHTSSPYFRLMLHENATRNLSLQVKSYEHRPSNQTLAKKKLGFAAALISNCGGTSNRLSFINELKRYVDVQIYGRCGTACPAKINCREYLAENFYYLLTFENSLCTEYVTEKFFATLEYPVVPVVLGRMNYSLLIPPSGFINVRDFVNVRALAQHLNETRYNQEKYLSYFSWKKDYVWGLNHFFNPFCDLCLRLHLDTTPKVIDDIHSWWFDQACESANVPR